MSIFLKNATYINWENLKFSHTNIRVEEGNYGKIEFIDDIGKINPSDEIIDCSGKLVTKSFAVGHHHVYSALSRGMPAPKKIPNNFHEILQNIWWKIDKALDKKMIEASALATAISCAKSGSTFVIDHHASPNHISDSLNIIANAFDKVGISHLLCYEITDRDGKEKADAGLTESDNYLKYNQGLIGMHASFTVEEKTMNKASGLISKHNSGVHIHVAEDNFDQKHCIENYNKRVIERLNDHGILNSSKTILGHCLHINDKERNLIKESKAYIVQNSESNLNNNVGFFNSEGLGENIMLGTDGMHSDPIKSAQAAYFIGKIKDKTDFLSAYKRFRNVHNYLNINKFIGDGENNLVILDYDSPTEINKDNFIGHFIFGLSSKHIQDVISNGKVIVKDKTVQTIDEEKILAFSKEQSIRLWNKL